jgi:hypothetical protein
MLALEKPAIPTSKEFFFIVNGALDVMRDGEWSKMVAGGFHRSPT